MYLAVDVGGTKVLMATFTKSGKLVQSVKFPTPKSYYSFLTEFTAHFGELNSDDITAAAIAIPGQVDRKKGIGITLGNLAWHNFPLRHDITQLLHCPTVLENDAKAGGLAEAKKVSDQYQKVLYLAIGTGIGLAYIADGKIDQNFGDLGARDFLIQRKNKIVTWEAISSGHAIVETYGKKASEITDPKIWQSFAKDLALGLVDILNLMDTDVVVVGGGVGQHFDKFGSYLKQELKELPRKMLKIPPVIEAQRAEEAVVYGCYYLAKEADEHTR